MDASHDLLRPETWGAYLRNGLDGLDDLPRQLAALPKR